MIKNDAGGGAGGSILLGASIIDFKSTGQIFAKGAPAQGNGGAGSGGRVKLYYF